MRAKAAFAAAGGLVEGVIEGGSEGSDPLVVAFEVLFLLGGILFGLAATEYARSATCAPARRG